MAHTPEHSPEALSIGRVTPREPGAVLELSSDAIDVAGAIDARCSALGGNQSPALEWTPLDDAGAWALIVEDPDAPREHPFVHWMIWNIAGEAEGLPSGLPNAAYLESPQGPVQGRNDMGSAGWFGPQPPPGTGVHRYHFQLFALDGRLALHADAPLRALVDTLKGRVVAQTELVGTFAASA
jgi:Raf kinase inhibitor-like YbhB/YbcL family protein